MGSCGELKLPRHLPLRFLSKRQHCRRLMVSQTLLLAHITCLPGIQNPLFSSTLGESVRSSLNGGGGRRNPSTFAYLLHLVTLVYSAGRIITFVSIHQLWEPVEDLLFLPRNPWHLIQPIRNPSTFDCYLLSTW